MAFNGSGSFSLAAGNPVVTGTTISSTWANNTLSDIATGLSTTVLKDGQQTITANLPMSGFRHTGVGNATTRAALTYASAADVQDGTLVYLTAPAGTNTITATAAISMTAYATGQSFILIPANTNTGATTLQINGIAGAKNVFWNGAACVGGEIRQNVPVRLFYDGTQFHITGNGFNAPFLDTHALVEGSADSTKKMRAEVDGLTTATTRVWTVQDKDITVPGYDDILQKRYVINGSFAIAHRAMPTTDNAFCLDQWRLLLGAANAATVSQDTADVPTGAKYACKLVVGAGNNNKFGIFQAIQGVNIWDLRGQVVSIIVPLKATAGLTDGTGKIRIGICQFTGTEDSVSGDPISAWNAEGTNPTLAANWAYANTPAAISVTTSWAGYTVTNVAISASAVNLGLFIWSDDTANTAATDILRIGGYITLAKGITAPVAQVAPYDVEFGLCLPYCETSLPRGTSVSGVATGAGTGYFLGAALNATNLYNGRVAYTKKKWSASGTITVYSPVTGTSGTFRDINAAADVAATTGSIIATDFIAQGSASMTGTNLYECHWLADYGF